METEKESSPARCHQLEQRFEAVRPVIVHLESTIDQI